MTKSFKNKLVVCLLAVFIATSCFAAFAINSFNTRAEIFTYTQEVSVVKEQALSQSFLNGKKGYMFSTNKNAASVSLTNQSAGKFSVEFTPVSSTVGVNDFNSFTFRFRSVDARIGFNLAFAPVNDGVKMSVSLTNLPLTTKEVLFDGAFDNASDKAIAFAFDPELMQVYNAEGSVVADFKSTTYMMGFGMTTLIDSYNTYSVEMAFGGIKTGKTAKVILFELGGQKFDSAELVNTSAPVVYQGVELQNGVVGKIYKVNQKVNTYDVKDGFKDVISYDNIVVTDGLNNPVALDNGTFVPTEHGVYYVNYTPVDEDNLVGKTYSYPFYVFESQPQINFETQYPLSDMTVGKGSTIGFGWVMAETELSTKKLAVSAAVKRGQDIVGQDNDCSDGFKFTFANVGSYTVEFSATDSVGYSQTLSVDVIVEDCAVFKNVDAIKDVYAKNASLNLKSVYALYNSNIFDVNVLTTYPDGRTNDSDVILLDEEGIYKIDFSATIDSAEISLTKYFTVRNNNVSLWGAQDGLEVVSNQYAPSYADDNYCGTMLTVTRPIEAVYENVLDLSDNTPDGVLAEIFVAPTVAGTRETGCVEIILTDVYNEENVINIRLVKAPWSTIPRNSRMSIVAQPVRDFDDTYLKEAFGGSGDYQNEYYYGRTIYSSFYGKIENNNEVSVSQSVKLYFDYETGKIYASYASLRSTGETGKVVVANLSDEKYVGTGNAWKKFTTGEARLSVKISQIEQPTASVMILNIDGQSMSGEYTTDTTAPSIFIDYAGNSEKAIPYGIKGEPYKIFDVYSRDIAEGYRKEVDVKVYKNMSGVLSEVENNGSYFVPQTTGEYVIKYSVSDAAGNSAVKDVKITVKNQSEIAQKTYTFSDKLLSNVCVGQRVTYYAGIADGGSGALTTTYAIYKDGQQIQIDKNNSFLIEEAGEYQIKVKVKDYLSESDDFVYTITAEYSEVPVLEKITMPKAVLADTKFIIPQFKAVKYFEGGSEEVDIEYYLDGVKLDKNEFTPTETDKVKLDLMYGQELLASYDIGVTKIGLNNQYVSGYIYTNADIKVDNNGATITFSQAAFASVIKPASVDFLTFTIASEIAKKVVIENVDGEDKETTVKYECGANLSRVDFTLTDSLNPNISFTASLLKKDRSESLLEYNGVRYVIPTANFFSNQQNFVIEFDKNTNFIKVGSKNVCKITKCDNGDIFEGFTSGMAYLDLTMPEVDNGGPAAVGLRNFGGMIFTVFNKNPKGSTSLKIFGDFGAVEKGDVIDIPAATAFNMLSDIKSVTVTVADPDGDILLNKVDITQPKQVVANKVGGYKILYEAKSVSGTSITRPFTLTVMDRVPPIITVNGTIVEAAKLNSVINVPKMTVTDDNTPKEQIKTYVYCFTPLGQMIRLDKNSFKAEQKGTYAIVYYASDNDNAIATKIFYVVVR